MRLPIFLLTLAIGGIIACSGTVDEPLDASTKDDAGSTDAGTNRTDAGFDDTDAGEADGGGMLEACAPPLTATPTTAAVLPFGLYTVVAQGGTGDYRFRIEDNRSDAIINELSGAYLAGNAGGAVDTIVITDQGCIGEARVSIRVVDPLQIRPANITAPPGTAWTFQGVGGTGDFSFNLLVDNSGATLGASGAYMAGTAEGTDRVEMIDNKTGQTSEATIIVQNGAVMSPNPPVVFLPIGHTFDLTIDGGSGFVEVVESVTNFRLVDGHIIDGLAAGRSAVTLRDLFTNQTTNLDVTVVPPQSYTPVRFGPNANQTHIAAPGDLDGDGFDDLIVGLPDGSVNGYLAGAVFVYRGQQGGFDPTPAQMILGTSRFEYLANDITTGDFDGDGETDLVVGIPRLDNGGTDVGAAVIYKGLANGFFDPTPWRTLTGRFASDWYGYAVAACDFNNDGLEDLAVSGYLTEDRVRSTRTNNQGGVFVYLNSTTGFADTADIVMWGDVPDGAGAWIGNPMRLGGSLETGDVNGDGFCDIVAGAHEWDQNSNTNDGLIYVYAGSMDGVSRRPVLAWANDNTTDRGGQFGRRLSVADMDNDGKAEIAASNFGFDAGNSDQHGAFRVFRGRDFTGEVDALASYRPADFEYEHDGSFDWYGWDVAIGDVTNDGIPDLVTGNQIDEVPGGPGNTGTLAIWAGRGNNLPDPMGTPTAIGGLVNDDRIGNALTIIHDVDGDGRRDLVTWGAYAETAGGIDTGAPFVVTTADTPVLTPLEHPGEAVGVAFGLGSSIVGDVTGDGFEDLVVAAPQQPAAGRYAGAAWLYRGTATGFESEPALEFSGHLRHSGSDYFGWAVSPAGDFDGDGNPDFAVMARFEDLPSTFDTNTYAPEAGCNVTRTNSGAVLIFRGVSVGLPSSQPSFMYFGPVAGPGMRRVDGGFNFNGDAYDDLVVGSLDVDTGAGNRGMMVLVGGRPADNAGRVVVICDEDLQVLGSAANNQLGLSVAAIGDIDNDGCDEVAAGEPYADPVSNNEGVVRVIFGWGGTGCPATPMMTSLRSTIANAQAGYSIGGRNVDFDADSRPELAIGFRTLIVGGNTTGGAVVAYGDYIRQLPKEAVGNVPSVYFPMIDTVRPPLVAVGRTPGELAGTGVALIGGNGSAAGLVLGSPRGNLAGTTLSGGAAIYVYTGTGLSTQPFAVFGGETLRTGTDMGEFVSAGMLNGQPSFIVSSRYGSGLSIDAGSAYALTISAP